MHKITRKPQNAYIAQALFEYMVSLLISGSFLAALLGQIGVSDALAGIIASVISLACSIQLFSTVLIRPGRSVRKGILRLESCAQAFFAVLYLLPFIGLGTGGKTVLFVLCIVAAYLIHNLTNPVKYQWLMGFVDPSGRGRFCARMEIVSLIGGMAFTLTMGRMFDHYRATGQTRTGLLIGFGALLLMAVLDISMLAIEPDSQLPARKGFAFSETFRLLTGSRPLKVLFLISILWKAAQYISTPYYGTYLIGDLGFSLTAVSAISIAADSMRILASPFIGRLADTRGYRISLTICVLIAAVSFAVNVFLCPGARWLYIIHQVLLQISMAGIENGLVNITYDYVDSTHFAAVLGVKNALSGIAGFLVSLAGSAIVSRVQLSGCNLFGRNVYAQQILSLIACALSFTVVFCLFRMIRTSKNK